MKSAPRAASGGMAHGPLQVAPNGRFLVHSDGTPFFYLGDTAWELFHRQTLEEARHYLADRAGRGFTVIQAVALAEFDGLHEPNAYGQTPLQDDDPERPNEAYFEHVDAVVAAAEGLGLFVGLLPTWGDKWKPAWGKGPVIFNEQNARSYGEFLGRRYRERAIIWILGGDRDPETDAHLRIIRAMAEGLRTADGGRHLITFHPQGGSASSRWFHREQWFDFNMIQSGHAARDIRNWQMIAADYALEPARPCMDAEPCYEDHAVNWRPENGWFGAHDVRKAAYWAVFAGAHGHTYGCHDIWQFFSPAHPPVTGARTPWKEALGLPGADQMRNLKALMLSRPFLQRVPDQSLLIGRVPNDGRHVQATRAADGSYAMVYFPTAGTPARVDLGRLSGEGLRGWWYDVRTGAAQPFEDKIERPQHTFTSPGEGPDWVLVLDDASRGFPPPGGR
jgi:hypothetical protein